MNLRPVTRTVLPAAEIFGQGRGHRIILTAKCLNFSLDGPIILLERIEAFLISLSKASELDASRSAALYLATDARCCSTILRHSLTRRSAREDFRRTISSEFGIRLRAASLKKRRRWAGIAWPGDYDHYHLMMS